MTVYHKMFSIVAHGSTISKCIYLEYFWAISQNFRYIIPMKYIRRPTISDSSCVTKDNKKCIFPFKYHGVKYNGCTTARNLGRLWCSTANDKDGNYKSWGNCDMKKCCKFWLKSHVSIPKFKCQCLKTIDLHYYSQRSYDLVIEIIQKLRTKEGFRWFIEYGLHIFEGHIW